MKRTLTLILSALMLLTTLTFVSCTPEEENENVLRVGMECNYAPYNWSQTTDEGGAVPIANAEGLYTNGYDVQVAKNIADHLGMTLEIYQYEFNSLIPAVQSGALDLIIAGMSPSDERREKIDFSEIYYASNLIVVTKAGGNLEGVNALSGLAGKKIAAQVGTTHYTLLTEQTEATASELDDFSVMQIALEAGTIDGYVAEEPTAMAICTEGSGYTYINFVNNDNGFTVPTEDTSIAVGAKKGSELISKINEYLATFDTAAQLALMQEMAQKSPD